jgi:hypothetical protein
VSKKEAMTRKLPPALAVQSTASSARSTALFAQSTLSSDTPAMLDAQSPAGFTRSTITFAASITELAELTIEVVQAAIEFA